MSIESGQEPENKDLAFAQKEFSQEEDVSKTPELDTLVEQLEELGRKEQMTAAEVHRTMDEIISFFIEKEKNEHEKKESVDHQSAADSELKKLKNRIVERIENEPESTGYLSFLKNFLRGIDIESVSIIEDHSVIFDRAEGSFNPLKGEIRVRSLPALNALIRNLAIKGFDENTETIYHEYLHSTQYDVPEKERGRLLKSLAAHAAWGALAVISVYFQRYEVATIGLMGGVLNFLRVHGQRITETLYKEIHALRGMGRHSGEYDLSTSGMMALMEEYGTLGDYRLGNKSGVDRLIVINTQIKQLYALGLPDEEIGELIKMAARTRKTDILGARVKELMIEKGLTEEDIDDKVLTDELNRRIFIHKVKLIAQQEIKSLRDSLINPVTARKN